MTIPSCIPVPVPNIPCMAANTPALPPASPQGNNISDKWKCKLRNRMQRKAATGILDSNASNWYFTMDTLVISVPDTAPPVSVGTTTGQV